ncbi:MAG: DUF6273 domain-containing protein [Erysipelotrichaceae bacterium]
MAIQYMKDLPVGAKLKMGKFQSNNGDIPIVWKVIATNHHGLDSNYPAGGVTLQSDRIINNMAYDAKEPSNALKERANDGNNRYRLSNIRQWLNSELGAKHWFIPQNIIGEFHYNDRDEAPIKENIVNGFRHRPYHDMNGFLTMFREYELKSILTTKVKSGIHPDYDFSPTFEDSKERYDLVEDKFFLPSITELGFGANSYKSLDENEIEEGVPFEYFSNVANRKSKMESNCFNQSNYNTSTTKLTAESDTFQYMTRSSLLNSPSRLYLASEVLNVTRKPNDIHGLRPMCNVNGDTLVSTEVDLDGTYSIIADVAPVVEIQKIDVTDVYFNVKDMHGKPTEVKVYFNGVLINTFNNNLSQTLNIKIPFEFINNSLNELTFTTKDNGAYEGSQIFKLDYKKNLIKVGDTISGKNETFKVTNLIDNNDGTVSLNVDRNLKYRINKGRSIERLDFSYIPYIHLTDNYHSIPSYIQMQFADIEYIDGQAIEEWKLEADGVYGKTKIEINRVNPDNQISLQSVSQHYKFKEEM